MQENIGKNIIYWNDQGWCGSIVNVDASVSDGVATYNVYSLLDVNSSQLCWFGFQLFITPTERTSSFSFTLESSVSGLITVNGITIEIEKGVNIISGESFMSTMDPNTGSAIQFGTTVLSDDENSHTMQNATYKIYNIVFK